MESVFIDFGELQFRLVNSFAVTVAIGEVGNNRASANQISVRSLWEY